MDDTDKKLRIMGLRLNKIEKMLSNLIAAISITGTDEETGEDFFEIKSELLNDFLTGMALRKVRPEQFRMSYFG